MGSSWLLLLLLSSTLLFCSLSQPLQPVNSKHSASNRPKDQLYRLHKREVSVDYIIKIASAASPIIELIPVAGPIISEIIEIAGNVADATKPDPTQILLKELQTIETQLEKYNKEQTWNIWAAQYAKLESKINVGWEKFKALMTVLADKNNKKTLKTKHIDEFKSSFKDTAVLELHQVLTNKKSFFAADFEKLVTDHTKCHENQIRALAVFINIIILKGNTVSYYYYGSKGMNQIDKLTEIAFDCAKAMFELHKKCINDALRYVKDDVTKLIENISGKSERKQLAKKIRSTLEITYDRYDWMVVVFKTKKSKHDFLTILNDHILSGFTEVSHGEVTAAVARQPKGKHTKADEVRKAIEKCFEKRLPDCREVKIELEKCGKSYGIDLSKAFTAIHAYIDKSDDSYKALHANEATEVHIGTDASSTIPYVYKGNCKKYILSSSGKFRVLIKSDEELAEEPPCKKLKCNETNGKCELLDDNKIPVCTCKVGFYGDNCEKSVENYKESLKNPKKLIKL